METKEATVEILNDLILINNDRIEGYDKALKELTEEDTDLKPLFIKYIKQSHQCKMELGTEVEVLGSDIKSGTSNGGSIHRAWMDIKAIFTGHDRKAILSNCESGEDAVQVAYKSALEDEHLPAFLREIVTHQKDLLRIAHNEVKSLRDSAA